jgi:hypothetical protein
MPPPEDHFRGSCHRGQEETPTQSPLWFEAQKEGGILIREATEPRPLKNDKGGLKKDNRRLMNMPVWLVCPLSILHFIFIFKMRG